MDGGRPVTQEPHLTTDVRVPIREIRDCRREAGHRYDMTTLLTEPVDLRGH